MADNRLIERIESVAAFRLPSVPSELGVAGHAPDFGGNVPLSLQHLCRLGDFGKDGARAKQADQAVTLPRSVRREEVETPDDARFRILGHRRLVIVLVHRGDVVELVLAFLHHRAHTMIEDYRHFIGERRVIGAAVGNGRSDKMA